MDVLKVIDSGIVPIYEGDDDQMLIDARELHEFLRSDTRFNDWITRKLERYGFQEGEDFYSFLSKSHENGRPTKEYLLSIDSAKEIAMTENSDKGRMVRRYFIECEKRLRTGGSAANMEAAERLRQQAKRLEIMERNSRSRQARILKSAAEFFKAVLSDVSMRAIAGEITVLITGKYLVEPSEAESSSLNGEFDLSGFCL
jgi:phage anti-repressor protein